MPHQRLAAPGDLFVGEKPSGEPVQRAEEKLEAQANERALAPVAGNDALFENGEGQAYGFVLQPGDAARRPCRWKDGVMSDLEYDVVVIGAGPSGENVADRVRRWDPS